MFSFLYNFFLAPAYMKYQYNKLPKWLKASLWGIAILLLLVLILWVALAWYVHKNKADLMLRIESQLSEQLNGRLSMEDIEPALFRSFPNISVRIKGLMLTDSLYNQHKRPTIQLASLYVKVNLSSLLRNKPTISNLTMANGRIHIFTDSSGFSNAYLFHKQPKNGIRKRKKVGLKNFHIENVLFVFNYYTREKEFKVRLNDIDGHITDQGDIMKISLKTDAFVYQLGFRLSKGGFLINKTVEGRLNIIFDRVKKTIGIPERKLSVQGTPVFYSALFHMDQQPVSFTMLIKAPKIDYAEGASMLSRHINQKLKKIKVLEPINVQAHIQGHFKYPDTPIVHVFFATKKNEVITSYGKLSKATFKGRFTNYYQAGQGMADNNSAVIIPSFKGNWEGIPFDVDTIVMRTTLHPLLSCHLKADFPVERLNSITGNTFNMTKGKATIDLRYRGPITVRDNHAYFMTGNILLKDVAMTYLPRSLHFQKCNVHIAFTGKDMYLKNTTLSTQKSRITLDGIAEDFMKIYFTDPGKVVFNWNLESRLIDLNEFRTFLARRKKAAPTKIQNNKRVRKFNKQLDDMLEQSSMYLNIHIGQVTYRKFDARAIKAKLALKQDGIEIKELALQHAGGLLTANLNIQQAQSGNPFSMQAKVEKVAVNKLFEAFENFGQTTITADNLEGSFTADMKIKGRLQESGNLVQNSLAGRIDFKLTNGTLKQFKPLMQVQKFVFKKRNLDHITFKTLEDRLDIDHGKITIYPMEIQSSAINMKVQGVYALGAGTDIAIEVPLRDPKKDLERVEQGLPPKKKKGITIYLRAKDDKDGKVRIGWDPFKQREKDDMISE